jgi:hypothetical protein
VSEQTRQLNDKFILRFPDGMRDSLKAAAQAGNRSLNSEILYRLSTFEGSTMPAELNAASKTSTLTVRLTTDMRDKLDRLAERGPYRISITSIIERGIELAAQELETLNSRGESQ